MAFLTPSTAPDDYVYRVLRIPLSLDWLAAVGGALAPLFFTQSWEEFGALTPAEASEIAKREIMESFYGGSGLIGSIMPYATATIPPMMLPCDGSFHEGADYPLLYARIATELKQGSGFRTPDLKGRFVLGVGQRNEFDPLYNNFQEGGDDVHTLTGGEMPTHNHDVTGIETPYVGLSGVLTGEPPFIATASTGGLLGYDIGSTSSVGSNQPHNNMPPFTALNFGIVFA